MICTEEDEFTRNKFYLEARWEASLSNGLTCIQDDERPGLENNSWLRLKKYCYDNKVNINKLSLRFRNKVLDVLPEKSEGYLFRNAVFSTLHNQRTRKLFIVGHLKNNQVETQIYFVPELKKLKSELRDPNDEKAVGESLILNDSI